MKVFHEMPLKMYCMKYSERKDSQCILVSIKKLVVEILPKHKEINDLSFFYVIYMHMYICSNKQRKNNIQHFYSNQVDARINVKNNELFIGKLSCVGTS